MLQKYDGGASKNVYKIAAGGKSWIYNYESEIKQNFTVWAFEDKPNATKVVCGKGNSKQMVAYFFGKAGHVATVPHEQRCTVNSESYTTSSLEKFEKRTKKDELLFTMAMRVLSHRLKSASFWPAKTLNWWVNRRTAPNDFYLLPDIKKILLGQRFSPNSNFC